MLTIYRMTYYALIDFISGLMLSSSNSRNFENFRAAQFAIFIYTLIFGSIVAFILERLISGLNSDYLIILFLLVGAFNYVFLFDGKKHDYYLNNKGSIRPYGYILALTLVFSWVGAALFYLYYYAD